jgi:hypothetical protein
VILVDANLLIYAIDEASPRHRAARAWLEERLSSSDTFAIAWIVLLAFVRLTTNPRIFEQPLSVDDAFDIVDGWLAQPSVTVVHETARHSSVMHQLLEGLGAGGNLVNDAHLAAIAIEHGAELCSSDTDFARFPGLRWTDPFTR